MLHEWCGLNDLGGLKISDHKAPNKEDNSNIHSDMWNIIDGNSMGWPRPISYI